MAFCSEKDKLVTPESPRDRLTICSENRIRQLLEIEKAAKNVLLSLKRVYHGTPSKLEWSEFHVLRQALELEEL